VTSHGSEPTRTGIETDGTTETPLMASIAAIEAEFSGVLGVAARDMATGRHVFVNADVMMPTASVFKVPVMVEVFAQAAEGQIDMDRRVGISSDWQIGGTGVLADLSPGLHPTITDLVTLMIIISDNTAANVLIDTVGGVEVINTRLHQDFGIDGIRLHRRIDFDEIGDDVRRLAEATPRALMLLMEGIADGRVVDAAASRRMLAIMRRQIFLDQFPRYLDWHRDLELLGLSDSFAVACKTGVYPRVRADVGVVTSSEKAIAYAVMTDKSTDRSNAIEHEASVTIGRIGRAIVQAWCGGKTNKLLTSRCPSNGG
jgi:beta-lactamase class A